MSDAATSPNETARPRLSIRSPDAILCLVFLLGAAFYLWTAGTTYPLLLHDGEIDPYNQLAEAFLHLHLWVARAPAGLLSLSNPYDPTQNEAIQARLFIHDFALYNGRLYLVWGPGPAIVLLAPLHLLGLSPSSSLTASIFAIAGLGFALATVRVIWRQIGGVSTWGRVFTACAVACSSTVPFVLRRPSVYEEALVGGYGFAMAGVYLAASALVERRDSPRRLALASLAFGLATASRPTLGLSALLLVPVYLSLRTLRPRRELLMALALPVCACLLLLVAYNQARYGDPLEFGTSYQLASYNPRIVSLGSARYVLPGAWFYLLSPPRPAILFPFLALGSSPVPYPGAIPANYVPELVGGLLPMSPILIFLPALPWIWRRRPALLGPLAIPLMILAATAGATVLFLSFEFFSATERYEVDVATPLLFGALAAWLALTATARGYRRRLVQACGALFIAWGCFTGLSVSFTGYYDLLASGHPGTWATLRRIGSPLSTALAIVVGHPVLAEVVAPNPSSAQLSPTESVGLGVGKITGLLAAGAEVNLTIVSPGARDAAVDAIVVPAVGLSHGGYDESRAGSRTLLVRETAHRSRRYQIEQNGGSLRIAVHLVRGVNNIALVLLAGEAGSSHPAVPASRQLAVVRSLSLAGG